MKKLFIAATFLILCFSLYSQETYNKREYVIQNDTLLYRELIPEKVIDGRKYPLVVFLHGVGERGNDNEKQLIWGSQMFLNPVNRSKYPAYVIFPQCPVSVFGAYKDRPVSLNANDMPIIDEPTTQIKMVRALIKDYIRKGLVDPQRVYLIGLSMGAIATYDFVCRYPDIVAAAVPICGSINPARLKDFRDVKFRLFHGDADNSVPVESSRIAYKTLKKLGIDVEYTEFAGGGHGIWNNAFNTPDFMKWIFSISKSK